MSPPTRPAASTSAKIVLKALTTFAPGSSPCSWAVAEESAGTTMSPVIASPTTPAGPETEWERGAAWAFVRAIGMVCYYVDTNRTMAELGRSTLARLLEDADAG